MLKIPPELKVVYSDDEIVYLEYSRCEQLYSVQSFVQKISFMVNNIGFINANKISQRFY